MSTPGDERPGDDQPEEPRPEDAPLTEADVERMLRALQDTPEVAEPGQADRATGPAASRTDAAITPPGRLALVLTPVASAPALAGLCALAEIDVDVVPSSSGAVAALEITPERKTDADGRSDWDLSELLGPEDGGGFPPAAEELAANLSKLTRAGVVLMVGDLSTDVGIESGLSGHLSARRYAGGEPEGDVPAGLILASSDQVVEDLILGHKKPSQVKGHQRSGALPRWKAARLFGKGLRRRKS